MSILDQLECPICHETMVNPKTIPCQHCVCEGCLCQWVGEKGALICPLCITLSALPAGGVPALPTNITLKNLCDSVREKDTKENKLKSPRAGKKKKGAEAAKKQKDVGESEIYLNKDKGSHIKPTVGWPVKFSLKVVQEKGELSPFLKTPMGERLKLNVVNRNGELSLQFLPKMCGVYVIDVKQAGKSIKFSPLSVPIKPRGNLSCEVKGCLRGPRDLLIQERGEKITLIVSDGVRHSLAIVDPFGRELGRLFPSKKGGKDFAPMGLASLNDNIYVTDMNNQCVHVFHDRKWNDCFGFEVLSKPTGIAVDKHGNIYVADNGKGQIHVFNSAFLNTRSFSTPKDGSPKELKSPELITLNKSQTKLIVTDIDSNNLKIFNVNDGSVIKIVETRLIKDVARPVGVTVDNADNIYVTGVLVTPLLQADGTANPQKGVIIVYTSDGTFLHYIISNSLKNPKGIRVLTDEASKTSQMLLFVCDSKITAKDDGNKGGTKRPGRDEEFNNNGIRGFEI